ncbi:MAG: DUF389 domain-containing protein [Geodermatophilaceae bacterium]|nr:DUF389 domain-containing protein [Geodermatophilaceae bacterium]
MLHLRLMLPTSYTDGVVTMLSEHVGVANLARFDGAAVHPTGDVLSADVARESADEILGWLRGRGIDDVGTITLETIDTALSVRARDAEERAPGDGSDAVIWEQVVRTTSAEATPSVTYLAFLTIATILAACAIVVDSAVLIVGAMVLGPEFAALAAVCVGTVLRRWDLARRATLSLIGGFVVAILITTLLAMLTRWAGWIDAGTISGERVQTGFIVAPDRWSFVVALFAGIAGVLSLTASKSGALVGVFISVTTVPAAGNIALAMALADSSELRSSLIQLTLNIAAILVAGVATLLVQRAIWRRVPGAAPSFTTPPAGVGR